MANQKAPFPAVPDQFDLLAQVKSPTPPLSGTQSGSQVAISDEVREQMRVLANIMIDVFLEHRKVTREAKEEARGPELQ
jgi:hypothetical protein